MVSCCCPLFNPSKTPDPSRPLLAWLAPLLRLTPNTLDLESLSEAMVGYRETGIATDYEEHELGIGGFAVPVQTALGLFSVAVIVPAARIATVEAGVREALLACREDIEQRIGPTAP